MALLKESGVSSSLVSEFDFRRTLCTEKTNFTSPTTKKWNRRLLVGLLPVRLFVRLSTKLYLSSVAFDLQSSAIFKRKS